MIHCASEDLKPGDQLKTTDGKPHIVESVEAYRKTNVTVYNLSVAATPNYAVGQHGALVHNAPKCPNGVAPKTGAAAIHRGSGLASAKHKLAVDVAAGRKSRLELLRDLSGDEINQAAHFFRQQANRVGGKFKNAAREFNLARARYLEQGGPQPPVSLTEFMKLHGLTN